jgi:hypothetical protein
VAAGPEALDLLGIPGTTRTLRIDHVGRRKMPYPRHRGLDHNAAYCQGMMNRLRDITATWSVVGPDGSVEAFDAA